MLTAHDGRVRAPEDEAPLVCALHESSAFSLFLSLAFSLVLLPAALVVPEPRKASGLRNSRCPLYPHYTVPSRRRMVSLRKVAVSSEISTVVLEQHASGHSDGG
eukprot:3256551-Rhodomonas_salina.2